MKIFHICYDGFILLIAGSIVLRGHAEIGMGTFLFWCSLFVFGIYDLILRLVFKQTKGSLIFRLLPCVIGLGLVVSGNAALEDLLVLPGILFGEKDVDGDLPKWPPKIASEDDSYEDNWC